MIENGAEHELGNARFVSRLSELGCAALVDAMGRIHDHRAHILPMVSPDPGRPLFGPAATIAFMPRRDDLTQSSETFADFFYQAVGESPAGRVLVLSSGGYPDVSHAGGTKLSRVAHHGLAGVLADGRLRDFRQLREQGFATWCNGESTRWGGEVVMPYAADVTVEFAGVCITPGDYVYADSSGAVVIPSQSLHRVLEIARKVEGEDSHFLEQIRAEQIP
ncbi:RraA family protein [Streptomyces cadmiisoli]|uniref:Putative 4-hydroxy-4-methyl-2-oxoglutarate aldolase n=1 Tax=Streptomyces cadmiisoli TaxID=2184053 RepID=A0A2Z4JAV0_9ACTN|nr:RraA family protein [Streptomyces cadmiisoli]AWW41503.1 RraA family protein [Streptomyces cadmiisoli]